LIVNNLNDILLEHDFEAITKNNNVNIIFIFIQ